MQEVQGKNESLISFEKWVALTYEKLHEPENEELLQKLIAGLAKLDGAENKPLYGQVHKLAYSVYQQDIPAGQVPTERTQGERDAFREAMKKKVDKYPNLTAYVDSVSGKGESAYYTLRKEKNREADTIARVTLCFAAEHALKIHAIITKLLASNNYLNDSIWGVKLVLYTQGTDNAVIYFTTDNEDTIYETVELLSSLINKKVMLKHCPFTMRPVVSRGFAMSIDHPKLGTSHGGSRAYAVAKGIFELIQLQYQEGQLINEKTIGVSHLFKLQILGRI